jgi:hypothetical protein
MPTAVDAAIAEIEAKLRDFEDPIEGFDDFDALDIQSTTESFVHDRQTVYQRRRGLLETALAALQALKADGHPEIPILEIPQEAYADLVDQQRTINAALARFAPNVATSMTFADGPVEPKQ